MVFAVGERPFFAEVVAAFEHFAVGVVTVVFVAGYQSVGLAVFDHDVVAVGETAQFFAVASVNGGQIAVAVVVVTHQFLTVEGDGGEAVRRRRERRFSRGRLKVGFQTTSMLTANEIVKEQMVQTTSKKIVRSSEKQKPRACIPHTPYVRTESFVRATACYFEIGDFMWTTVCFMLINISLPLTIFFSWVFKSSYKLQIIVKFTWIFLIKCCIRIVI